jgi:hypothetical protein
LHRQPEIPPAATGSLGGLLSSMTASDPRLRPSAASAAEALTLSDSEEHGDATTVLAIESDATAAIPVMPLAASLPERRPRRRMIASLVIAAIVVTLFTIGYASGGGDVAPADVAPSTTPTTAAPSTAPPSTAPPTTAQDPRPRGKGKKGD